MTASLVHHMLLLSLSAKAVFDYRDPAAVVMIKALSNRSIRITFDGVGVQGSTRLVAEAMVDEGGKVVTIM